MTQCVAEEELPAIEYGPQDIVRKVQDKGRVSFQGKVLTVPKVFKGHRVALRAAPADGLCGDGVRPCVPLEELVAPHRPSGASVTLRLSI